MKVLNGGTTGTKYNYFTIHETDASGKTRKFASGRLNKPFRHDQAGGFGNGEAAVDADLPFFRMKQGHTYMLSVSDRLKGKNVRLGQIQQVMTSRQAKQR